MFLAFAFNFPDSVVTNAVNWANHEIGLWKKLVEPSVAIFSATVVIDQRAVQFFYEISEMGRLSETAADIEYFFPIQIHIGEQLSSVVRN